MSSINLALCPTQLFALGARQSKCTQMAWNGNCFINTKACLFKILGLRGLSNAVVD